MGRPRKPNLWARITDHLVLEPEPANFTAEDFFVLALIPESDWPNDVKEAHWVWKGTSVSNAKRGSHTMYPVIRIAGQLASVRKTFMAMNCYEFPLTAAPTPMCPEPNCVNPLHMRWTERTMWIDPAIAEPDNNTAMEELAEEIERLAGVHRINNRSELLALAELQDWSQDEILTALNISNVRTLP